MLTLFLIGCCFSFHASALTPEMEMANEPSRESQSNIDGLYVLDNTDEFQIVGTALTCVKGFNVGGTYTVSDLTANSFKVSDYYGGGSATYSDEKLTFANGQVAEKVDCDKQECHILVPN
mmetsp:Transcript_30664/g.55937  ORF Transcript_30664/g.55937 Transcript_30664/m.55937 type:complete len:120 (-) Transcript_30664:161-520(-)